MAIHETTSSGTAEHGTPVAARVVEDAQRLMTLPHHFGNRLLAFEAATSRPRPRPTGRNRLGATVTGRGDRKSVV